MPGTFGSRAEADRWRPHEVASFLLRTFVVLVSLVVSAGVGLIVGWNVPGAGPFDITARVVAAGLASVATAIVFESLSRRLMPLAALLRMSLAFPDQAPSRFAIAMRSTSVRRLREWARADENQMDAQALSVKVLTLASALNFHDRQTRGHSERTRALAELVVEEMGLSKQHANEVRWGAFLHDIGKLLVPSAVLNKVGTLSEREWEQVREHPAAGGRLVRPLRPFIGSGVEAVACHHESFDGTGYPNGLGGEDIALAARIVAVVDSFEVMTAVRSYKRPMSSSAARRELVKEAGKQFDPQVVRAFLNVSLGRLHWSLGLAAWVAQLPFIGVIPRAAAQVGAAVGAGSSAVTTATLASMATASLGATLAVSPLATNPPDTAAGEPPVTSVAVAVPTPGPTLGVGGTPHGAAMATLDGHRAHRTRSQPADAPSSVSAASGASHSTNAASVPGTVASNGSTRTAASLSKGNTVTSGNSASPTTRAAASLPPTPGGPAPGGPAPGGPAPGGPAPGGLPGPPSGGHAPPTAPSPPDAASPETGLAASGAPAGSRTTASGTVGTAGGSARPSTALGPSGTEGHPGTAVTAGDVPSHDPPGNH